MFRMGPSMKLLILEIHEEHASSIEATGIGEYYIGGTDMVIDGEWVWASTFAKATPNYWSPGEPNNDGGSEDCHGHYQQRNLERCSLWHKAHFYLRDIVSLICFLQFVKVK